MSSLGFCRSIVLAVAIITGFAMMLMLAEPAYADVLPPRPKPKPRPPKPQPPLPKPLPPIEPEDSQSVAQDVMIAVSASAFAISLGFWLTRRRQHTNDGLRQFRPAGT